MKSWFLTIRSVYTLPNGDSYESVSNVILRNRRHPVLWAAETSRQKHGETKVLIYILFYSEISDEIAHDPKVDKWCGVE